MEPPVAKELSSDVPTNPLNVTEVSSGKHSTSTSSKKDSKFLNHNPEGLSARSSKYSLTHEKILEKYLHEDEIVLREFNCYFPNLYYI